MDPRLESLRSTGLCVVEPFPVQETVTVRLDLTAQPVFWDAHVPQTSRNRGDYEPVPRSSPEARESECVCVHNDRVLLAPHLLERALGYTDLVAAYLGRDPPVMYSANAFWTRPGVASVRDDIQAFHEDRDDARFVAMFVYLDDVSHEDDGPHELTGPDGTVRAVYGRAGTVFLADTSRMHRGQKPKRHERGFLWFRWGVSDRPPANEWDKIEPIAAALLGARYPSDSRLRESIRLLVT